jgi:F420-non-reducing hydrogenase small subunit
MTMEAGGKPRLAVYWTTGCGGCDASFLDLGDRLFALEDDFELVFFPLLSDRKREYLENLADRSIDLCLLTGAIRTREDEEMARLLRRVSSVMVAFGACAQLGSVLGLADLVPVETLLRTVFGDDIPEEARRQRLEEGEGRAAPGVPGLTPSILTLEALVPVEYVVPGCPPEVERLWDCLRLFRDALGGEGELPDPGSVLGTAGATVCEDCSRTRFEGQVDSFRRRHQVDPDPDACLLEAGLICSGPATSGGCGAPCPAVGAPCRGCYGPPLGIEDQGARMLAALAALARIGEPGEGEDRLARRSEEVLSSVVDPVGTLYRYCFSRSFVARLRQPREPAP